MADKPKEVPAKDLRTVPAHCRFLSFVLIVATVVFGCLVFTSITPPKFWGHLVPWRRFFGVGILANVVWFYSLGLIYAKDRRQFKARRFNGIVTVICLLITFGLGWWMRPVAGIQSNITLVDVIVDSAFYLSVLLNAGWFFYLLAPLVRAQILNAILFMVLFVWGCVLYYCFPVDDSVLSRDKVERQIEAPNRTVAAFFPSRGGFETVAKDNNNDKSNQKNTPRDKPAKDDANGLRLHYFVFHTFVLFYVALITFSIFGRGIVNGVRKWLTSWMRLNVFWGRSDAGLLLARSIVTTTDGDEVFFMLQQKSGDGDEWRTLTRDIDDMKGMWSFTYDSNAVETDVSKDKLSQAKGRRHFFMDESGHVNVSMADRIVNLLRDNRPTPGISGLWKALCAGMIVRWWKDCYVRTWKDCREWWKYNPSKSFRHKQDFLEWCKYCKDRWGKLKWDKPFLYVRIEAPSDELTYQTWAANVREFVTPVLVRESQLVAKDFIKKYPLLNIPRVAEKIDTTTALVDVEKINILLIGLGSTGQDILNEIICNGQFVRSYKKNGQSVPVHLHVDVVEQDEKVIEEYCIRHPLATRHPKFSAIELGNGQGGCRRVGGEDRDGGDPRYDVVFVDGTDNGIDKNEDKIAAGEHENKNITSKNEDKIIAGGNEDKCNKEVIDGGSVRVEDKTFDDWFRKRLDLAGKKCPYDRIIVCLKGDDKTLGIGRKIVEFSRRYGVVIGSGVVFAHVKDPSRNRYLPHGKIYSIFSKKNEEQDAGITLFGDLDKIYSFERIDVETVDEMAKVINSRYNKSKDGRGFRRDLKDKAMRELEWENNASFFDQLSSRAAAEGQRNLLLLRGLDYRENVKSATDDEVVPPEVVDAPLTDDSFNKEQSVLKTLAINEHLRWNAFHIMMGYRQWKVLARDRKGMDPDARKDLPEPRPEKIRANQLATIGKHADMVPFDTLPEVAMLLEEWNTGHAPPQSERWRFEGLRADSPQAWDIAFCQIIGKVAAEAGQEIVRCRREV